jgi:hypothetical protein
MFFVYSRKALSNIASTRIRRPKRQFQWSFYCVIVRVHHHYLYLYLAMKKRKSPSQQPVPKDGSRVRPTNNQLLYRAHLRWNQHYPMHLVAGLSLPSETAGFPSVTSAFLKVLSALQKAEEARTGRSILQVSGSLCVLFCVDHPADSSQPMISLAAPLHKHTKDQGCGAVLWHASVSLLPVYLRACTQMSRKSHVFFRQCYKSLFRICV